MISSVAINVAGWSKHVAMKHHARFVLRLLSYGSKDGQSGAWGMASLRRTCVVPVSVILPHTACQHTSPLSFASPLDSFEDSITPPLTSSFLPVNASKGVRAITLQPSFSPSFSPTHRLPTITSQPSPPRSTMFVMVRPSKPVASFKKTRPSKKEASVQREDEKLDSS